jgi:hypothetical protein
MLLTAAVSCCCFNPLSRTCAMFLFAILFFMLSAATEIANIQRTVRVHYE